MNTCSWPPISTHASLQRALRFALQMGRHPPHAEPAVVVVEPLQAVLQQVEQLLVVAEDAEELHLSVLI